MGEQNRGDSGHGKGGPGGLVFVSREFIGGLLLQCCPYPRDFQPAFIPRVGGGEGELGHLVTSDLKQRCNRIT